MLYNVFVYLATPLLIGSQRCRRGQSYLTLFIDQRMNVTNNKLPYEAPAADAFQLSAAPLNICIQFSGDADFNDFEEGEAL